jgi:hypothetical protein
MLYTALNGSALSNRLELSTLEQGNKSIMLHINEESIEVLHTISTRVRQETKSLSMYFST